MKPETIGVRLDTIPEELRVLDRWILWTHEKKKRSDGSTKWTKIPKQANRRWAAVNAPDTWCTFDIASKALQTGDFSGLGLVIPKGIVGVDLDDCHDGNGFSSYAKMLLAMFPTYAEISPSGNGVKMLAAGALDPEMRQVAHHQGVEMYDGATTGRFFCITGHVLESERHHRITGQRESLHALQAMISEPKKAREQYEKDPDKVSKALDYLHHLSEERCEDYTDWLSAGMALHWCDPSDDMFEHWCRWSQQSAKFDEEDARRKWQSFDFERNGRIITLGWLERAARDDGYEPNRFRTGMMTGTELLRKKIEREYLIEDFMTKGEPMIIGGATKALKTTVGLDMAVSISSGTPFLGVFNVPNPEKVLFISGESGDSTLQENLRTMAEKKGIPEDRLLDFHISFILPKLNDPSIVDDLIQELKDSAINIVFIDPLYRSLRVGDGASNVYMMGEQLELIAEKIHRAGITVVLMHHFKKQGKSYAEAPELEDLSQSGVAEFGRQFLLLKRREPYKMDGNHVVWFHWGGSAGHQGMKMLEAYTGTRKLGLTWEPTLRSPEEWKETKKEMERVNEEMEHEEDKDQILDYVIANPGCNVRSVRAALDIRSKTVSDLIEELEIEGHLVVEIGKRKAKLLYPIDSNTQPESE